MKKEIIIHIGLHRTGTTFLQKEVFEKLPINYIFDDAIHRIQIKDGINLISNEGLSLSMPHSKFDRIQVLDHLKKLFPNAKIIVGFRKRETWLRSCYYRYILSGGKLKYQEYVEEYANNIIGFDDYLHELRKRFKGIYIYHFEDLKTTPNECVRDICKFIGVEKPKFKNIKRNVSLNEKQIETLRKLNHTNISKAIVPIIKFIQRTPT